MERRTGLRGRTDFSVIASNGFFESLARGIELSGSGLVLDRGRPIGERDSEVILELRITLPERERPIVAWARPVRSEGAQQALRFVRLDDVDRLCLAEHLDLVQRRGGALN